MICPTKLVVCKKCGCVAVKHLCRTRKDKAGMGFNVPICPRCRKEIE